MQKLVFRNANGTELDLTTDPFGITDWSGFSADDLNIQSQQVPFQDGAVYLDGLLGERDLSVTVAMNDENNLETRYRLRREMISKLNPKLGEGVLIYTNDFLTKQIHVIPQLPVFENHNSNDSGTPKVSCSFTACNPYWEDLEETVVIFNSGDIKTIENEGDVKIGIEIDGNFSSNEMTFKNITTETLLKLKNQDIGNYLISTKMGNKVVEKINADLNYLMKIALDSCIGRNGDIVILTRFNVVVIKDFTYIEYVEFNSSLYIGETPRIEYCEEDDTYYIGGQYGLQSTKDFIHTTPLINSQNIFLTQANYFKDKYIAISEGSAYYYSTDSIQWTPATLSAGEMKRILYSAEKSLYVGVGSNSTKIAIFTSADGVTWTPQTVPDIIGYLNYIVYSAKLELFIAVGNNGIILTSPDGTTWTQRTSGINTELTSVACNDKYIIAVGEENSLISTNGITWNSLDESFKWIFFENWFVGITSSCGVKYSSNGTRYNEVIETGGQIKTGNIRELKTFGNKMIAYVQWYSDVRLLVTDNGWQTWGMYSVEDYNQQGINFTYAQNKGLYVYTAGSKICTSSDLINWTEFETNDLLLGAICYSEEKELFLVVGEDKIWKSSDGLNWTSYSCETGITMDDIIYSEYYHKFYYASYSYIGMQVKSSENGVDWTIETDIPFTALQGRFKINTEENIIAVTMIDYLNTATPNVIFTKNGSSWVNQIIDYETQLEDICVHDGVIYLYSSDNEIFTISDVDSWVIRQLNVKGYGISMTVFDNKFYYSGLDFLGEEVYAKEGINCIDKLTAESNMNLSLVQGVNKLMFENINGTMILKYRQKYVGV